MRDAVATMGDILPSDVGGKDAVHVAVIDAVAGMDLMPANHVNLLNDEAHLTGVTTGIGIVDPFISKKVAKGERFWLFLYPRSITGLKHEWSHPVLDKMASEKWLRNYVKEELGEDNFDEFIALMTVGKYVDPEWDEGTYANVVPSSHKDGDYYMSVSGQTYQGSIRPEMWHHLEVFTGEKVSEEKKKAKYFVCSC